VVDELAVLVKDVELGRDAGAQVLADLLRRIVQVGELEALLLGRSTILSILSASPLLTLMATRSTSTTARAVAYETASRLRQAVRREVDLVAINVNNGEADKIDKMVERAKEKGFKFPYLYDPSQKIGKDLGARVTPEFYVFDKNRKLVYHGAMDDAQDGPKVNYSTPRRGDAEGEKVEKAETRARGCGVQYDK